jgi:hypothetical protein
MWKTHFFTHEFLICLLLVAKGPFPLERFTATESSAVVISTGNGHRGRRSPIERVATMSIACENRAAFRAAKRSIVETGLGPFPLDRFTAAESSAVVIFTGNVHRGRS